MNELQSLSDLLANKYGEYGGERKWEITTAEKRNDGTWQLIVKEIKDEGAENESNK